MVCLTESDSVKFFAPGFRSAATLLLMMGAVLPGILSSVPNVLILRTTAVRWELCDGREMNKMGGNGRSIKVSESEDGTMMQRDGNRLYYRQMLTR